MHRYDPQVGAAAAEAQTSILRLENEFMRGRIAVGDEGHLHLQQLLSAECQYPDGC